MAAPDGPATSTPSRSLVALRTRALLTVWLAVAGWSSALHFRAATSPPPGSAFAGSFHFIDDVHNYLSYAQQAEEGRFLFRNKLLAPAQARPELVNVEWWLSGRLAAGLDLGPAAAFRVLGALALLGLLAGCRAWLEALGVRAGGLGLALALVAFGGGLGGLLFEWTDRPVTRCLDIALAFFPFFEALANPHFVAGTALLCAALRAFALGRGLAGPALGIGLGTLLGVVRPYDLAVLGAARLVAVLATQPLRAVPAAVAPLVGLLPVLGYDCWLFFGSDQFTLFQRGNPTPPALADFLPALGPALLLALWASPRVGPANGARAHLWAWFVCALLAGVVRGGFALQFLMGSGTPLLLLGAAGLASWPPRRNAAVVAAFALSAVAATRIALQPDPNWFVPRERLAVAAALEGRCPPNGRLMAPPDVGLYALAYASCHVWVAHPAVADYPRRLAALRAFYSTAAPGRRAALLDAEGITHVVLPGDAGPRPVAWLGETTTFRFVTGVGEGPARISVYAR